MRWMAKWTVVAVLGGCAASAVGQAAQKPMAVDADPAFEVATIKPNDSGMGMVMGLGQKGREFAVKNANVYDLIEFAYGVHAKQIKDGPKELEKTRFDLTGVPDVEGVPTLRQQQKMVQKLLADRFKLKYHEEKDEMPAFVLTVGKDGVKAPVTKPRESLEPVNDIHFAMDGITLTADNASPALLCGFLQMVVVDRPVVDHTGIATTRYDMTFKFTPDPSMFNGRMPQMPESPTAAPSLAEAVQKDLGFKLTSEKAEVKVIAIDHVEAPTAN